MFVCFCFCCFVFVFCFFEGIALLFGRGGGVLYNCIPPSFCPRVLMTPAPLTSANVLCHQKDNEAEREINTCQRALPFC